MGQQLKRRIYLIDRTFQLKFVRLFIGIMVVLTGVIGTVSYQVLNKIVEKHLYSPHISALSSGEIIGPALFWINICFTALLIFAAVIFIFFYLRRVSGSLRRFSTHLDKMSGHLIPQVIHFRRNDPLHMVANDFNIMAAHLEKKITATRDYLQQAVDGLHDLRVSHAADSKISSENFQEIQHHLIAAEKEIKA
jgi:methyl-accepting chemotaxis protein